MSHKGFIIAWLILVVLTGDACWSDSATGEAEVLGGRFIKYDNGTALDTKTRLMWMTKDFRLLEGRAPRDSKEAKAWVDKMNQQRYGGYDDWRIPTLEEYEAIYDKRRQRRSYRDKRVGYPEVFADGGGEYFWVFKAEIPALIGSIYHHRWGSHPHIVSFTHLQLGNSVNEHDIPQQDSNPSAEFFVADSVMLMRNAPQSPPFVAVLKSSDLLPFNQVLTGFRTACQQTTTTYDLRDSTDTKHLINRIMADTPSLVLAIGPLAAQIARAGVQNTPVVYVMDYNAHSHSQQSAHFTGVSLHVPVATQLSTYRLILPNLQSIGVIYNPKLTGVIVAEAEKAVQSLGLRLYSAAVTSAEGVPAALRRLLGRIDALWIVPDDTVVSLESFQFMTLTALEHGLPLLAFSDAFVEAGALAALSPDYADMGRPACQLAKDTANGYLPPLAAHGVPPEKVNLTINLDVARKLGLAIPRKFIASAHKVYD